MAEHPSSMQLPMGMREQWKLFLGGNPDRQDNEGQTPLFAAAEHGRDGVMKMLLTRNDIAPDKPED